MWKMITLKSKSKASPVPLEAALPCAVPPLSAALGVNNKSDATGLSACLSWLLGGVMRVEHFLLVWAEIFGMRKSHWRSSAAVPSVETWNLSHSQSEGLFHLVLFPTFSWKLCYSCKWFPVFRSWHFPPRMVCWKIANQVSNWKPRELAACTPAWGFYRRVVVTRRNPCGGGSGAGFWNIHDLDMDWQMVMAVLS